jgi:aryl-alcohol dehydrogenase-like predicted oxidoreductase
MRFRRLGNSGLAVSVVGLGCNAFGSTIDAARTREVVAAALDVGITLFDTADVYGKLGGSEEILGKVLKGHRDEVVIATKFGREMRGANGPDWDARGARRYIVRAVEASLRRLDTDWIDLYLMHTPDPATPIEETLTALDDVVRAGKVRYLGNSKFAAWQVADADWVARSGGLNRFVCAENQYNLLQREAEAELVPACQRFAMGLLPYYPLARGLLTGKYRRGEPAPPGTRLASPQYFPLLVDAPWDTIEALEGFAAERGRSLLEVAIAGLAARPTVASVIAGATAPEQVRQNAAAGQWEPSAEDLATLNDLLTKLASKR